VAQPVPGSMLLPHTARKSSMMCTYAGGMVAGDDPQMPLDSNPLCRYL
jgi:hypothetical protein